ncbi:hypothetical protein [Saccharothrix hoggarensis]|uniref:Uncharacterized protein n=1 Tax=Saccharothrix hoggarensis TaxID=913853 RepID=A0ABW3QHW4_9PSEU
MHTAGDLAKRAAEARGPQDRQQIRDELRRDGHTTLADTLGTIGHRTK